jgi:hypothetical protein
LTNGTQQTSASGANNCTIHAFDGSQFIEYSGPGQYSIQASLVSCQTGATLLTNNVSIDNQCNYHLESFGDSSFTGRSVSLHFTDTTNNVPIINSQCFVYNGDSIQYEQASVCGNVSCSINWISAIDFVSNGRSDISFGTYLSPTYDTGFKAPVVIQTATVTANSFLPSVVLQNAPSTSGPFTDINTGVNFSGQTSRYLRYISSFTAGSTDDVLSTLSAESLQWEASSGVFVSQVHQVSPISSFGNFATTMDLTKGGNIAYSICTAATSNMNGEVCTVQVPNAQITASTNSFIQVIATFTVTAATNTPTLDLFSVQWYSGNRSPGMASTVWHGRYWLSLSTNPVDNFNDAILVLDDKGAWAPMNIPAGGLIQSKGNLYIADSHPTGNDYVYGNGYRDNGAPINAFIVTKDYPESDLNTDDYYESLYVSEDNLGNFNTTISYAMDRNLASAFNLSSINQSEYVNNAAIKVPFVFGNQDFGKCISLTFTEADLDSPWNFYGFTLYYHDRVVQ